MTTPTLPHNPVPLAFVRRSFAFLSAAEKLTQSIAVGDWTAAGDRDRVVLWLTFHASELFCKGCLTHLDPAIPVTHSLATLLHKMEDRAPGTHFDPPFQITVLPSDASSEETAKQQHRVLHERFRYPVDKTGDLWGGVNRFDVSQFIGDLEHLRREMLRVYKLIFGAEPVSDVTE